MYVLVLAIMFMSVQTCYKLQKMILIIPNNSENKGSDESNDFIFFYSFCHFFLGDCFRKFVKTKDEG